MEKLIILANKLANNKFKDKTPSEIFNYLKSDPFGVQIYNAFGPLDSIILCFLIYLINDKKVPSSALKFIIANMFSFKIMEIVNDSVSEECHECYGNGSIDCYNCDGSGDIQCETCDGDGYEEDEETRCGECGGDGTVECGECYGTGNVECGECDGSGEINDSGRYEVIINEYISINPKLYNLIEVLDENEILKNNLLDKINKNLTILVDSDETQVTSSDADYQGTGDYLFKGYTKEMNLIKNNYGLTNLDLQ